MTTRLTLAAAALLAAIATAPATAADRSFIIPANDGYGIADCLGEGGPCARVVADAWCAVQGLGKAVTFGPADAAEMTASLKGAGRASAQAYTVTCNE